MEFTSIGAMKAASTPPSSNDLAFVLGYYLPGDGGGGEFYWDAASTEDDNQGTIIKRTDNIPGRWKRIFSGPVNVKWFGAKGDANASITGTDDYAAILKAIAYMQSIVLLPASVNVAQNVLYFPASPKSLGYLCSGDLDFGMGYGIIMDAPVYKTGPGTVNGVFMKIGESGKLQQYLTYKLWAKNKVADWSVAGYKGIQFINAYRCDIDVVNIYGFTIGLECAGLAKGFSYSKITGIDIDSNKIGINIVSDQASMVNNLDIKAFQGIQDQALPTAFVTECAFYINRIGCGGNLFTDQSRYGVCITGQDYSSDNLNFYKTCFELQSPQNEQVEAIPVVIEGGRYNAFYDARHEGNSKVFIRCLSAAFGNEVYLGFCAYPYTRLSELIDDQSDNATNKISTRTSKIKLSEIGQGRTIFASGNLANKAVWYDATALNIAGLHVMHGGGLRDKKINPNTSLGINPAIGADYVQVPAGNALCVYLDTTFQKRFILTANVEAGYPHEVCLKFYDLNGEIRTGNTYLDYMQGVTMRWAPGYYGGVYREYYADRPTDFYFTVNEAIQKVEIIIAGRDDSQPIKHQFRIHSFDILNIDGYGSNGIWNEFSSDNNFATQIPVAGSYKRGQLLLNDTAGSDTFGWICTTDGTPGVWKTLESGLKVSAEGASNAALNGALLEGSLVSGAVVTKVVTDSGGTSINYPTNLGQAFNFNGIDFRRGFSLFKNTTSRDLYYQHFNIAGTGQGWAKMLDSVNTPLDTIVDTMKSGVYVPTGGDLNTILYNNWGLYNASAANTPPVTAAAGFWFVVTQNQYSTDGSKMQIAYAFRNSTDTWQRQYNGATSTWGPWRTYGPNVTIDTTSVASTLFTNTYMNTAYPDAQPKDKILFTNLTDKPAGIATLTKLTTTAWAVELSGNKLT
ncbi:hypothetical protein [Chitinophaga defluvii]|uniref:Uncharacterized protein n=1 Tax=Chitinophaga defluvii TaxID=3163343 RepID=A0ABV2T585_9BACT